MKLRIPDVLGEKIVRALGYDFDDSDEEEEDEEENEEEPENLVAAKNLKILKAVEDEWVKDYLIN